MKWVVSGWVLAAVFAFAFCWKMDWLPEMTVWGWIGWGAALAASIVVGVLLYFVSTFRLWR